MHKYQLILVLILSVLLFSCKSDKPSIDPTKEEVTATEDSITPKERHQIYLVTVDNLRVREASEKSSKVVDKLKERTIVYSTGEVSDYTEKVVLRNREFNTPYYKINYDGNTGWIYGGGLYKIYDESEPDSFTETFESMVTQLSSPNKRMLEKGKHIMKTLRQESSGSTEWNDILYLIAEHQLEDIARDEKNSSILEGRDWTPEEYASAADRNYDMQSSSFASEYAQAGLKYQASEGMVGVLVDPKLIKTTIGSPFSKAMNAYIDIKITESDNRFFSDGAISSPLSNIVNHTVTIEKFLKAHPNFPRNNDLKFHLEYYHRVIINGSNNTPAYSYDTKKINTEWLEAWNQYLTTNKNGLIEKEIIAAQQKSKSK